MSYIIHHATEGIAAVVTQKNTGQKTKDSSKDSLKETSGAKKPYSKPRIMRHGNMRRLTQMSG